MQSNRFQSTSENVSKPKGKLDQNVSKQIFQKPPNFYWGSSQSKSDFYKSETEQQNLKNLQADTW